MEDSPESVIDRLCKSVPPNEDDVLTAPPGTEDVPGDVLVAVDVEGPVGVVLGPAVDVGRPNSVNADGDVVDGALGGGGVPPV